MGPTLYSRIIQLGPCSRTWRAVGVPCLAISLAGCATLLGGGPGGGGPVFFDPQPQPSLETEALRDVRYRRFASNDSLNASEWTEEPSIWPLDHPQRHVISRYGPRGRRNKMHNGIDIKAPRGTPIVASADGVVTYAGRRRGYGNVVEVDHGNGLETIYAHLNEIGVQEGVDVLQGEILGTVGATGNATTPHIHYEVRVDQQPHDPWLFLPAVEE